MLLKKKYINSMVKKFSNKISNKGYKCIIIKKKICKNKNVGILQSLSKHGLSCILKNSVKKSSYNNYQCKITKKRFFKMRINKTLKFISKRKLNDDVFVVYNNKRFIFKIKKNKKHLNFKFFKLAKKNTVKCNRSFFNNTNTNIFSLKPFLIFYNFCYLSISKLKLKLKLKYKIKNFYFKVKRQKELLLLNIFFNKKNVLKPTVAHVKKQKNFSIKIKFIKFFLKKLILNKKIFKFTIHFKIKKKYKEKNSLKKKRKFFLNHRIFKFFFKFILACKKILYIDVFFKPLYNRSHANNNLKNKKLRRKKRKKKKRS